MASRPPWYYDEITQRQRVAIAIIRTRLGIQFSGRCKGEASGFIGKHYELAKKLQADKISVEVVNNQELAKHLLKDEEEV